MDKSCPSCLSHSLSTDSFNGVEHVVCNSCGYVDESSSSNNDLATEHAPDSTGPGSKLSSPLRDRYKKAEEYKDLESRHSFRKLLAMFGSLCANLSLPREVRESAKVLLKQTWHNPCIKGKQHKILYVAACISLSAEGHGRYLDVHNLSHKIGRPKHKIITAKKIIRQELDIRKESHVPPHCVLNDICSSMAFSVAHGQKVSQRSRQLFDCLEPLITRQHFNTLFYVSVLYIAAECEGKLSSPNQFHQNHCKDINISVPVFRERISALKEILLQEARKVPWCPSHLSGKTVALFLDDIFRYRKTLKAAKDSSDDEHSQESNPSINRAAKISYLLALRNNKGSLDESSRKLDEENLNLGKDEKRLIMDLLDKGCTPGDIISSSYLELAKQYLRDMDSSVDNAEIADDEISRMIYTKEEVAIRLELKHDEA